eukprot:TRINITY_DN1016_c2_g1_i1.p1 TRINITY_DN1016_c2_g1~~TRINITY_DN1016_c2_g1_i1.p1  ORF type:complete len:348 (+),score=147.90 TRINITY_DN1016_c2_g1_i1:64-1107(+)
MYRAIVCDKIEENFEAALNNLKVLQLPILPCEPDQLRIEVKAVAINFFDLLMLVGKYQFKPELPFVPCCEGSGTIIEIGSNVKGNWKIGQKILFNSALGGAAAEQVVVPETFCTRLASTLSFIEGAAFSVGYITGYHGLVHRGHLQSNETLLVTGAAGGMGISAIQIGLLLGSRVIAAVSDQSKLEVLRKIFGDKIDYVNYGKNGEMLRDSVAELTNGNMANVIYESVGGEVFKQCLRSIGGQGRLLVIGFASGTIPSIPANIPLIKGFSIVGVRSGYELNANPDLAKSMREQLEIWTEEGKLIPHIYAVYNIENAKQAFGVLLNRSVIGKAVIEFNTSTTNLQARL